MVTFWGFYQMEKGTSAGQVVYISKHVFHFSKNKNKMIMPHLSFLAHLKRDQGEKRTWARKESVRTSSSNNIGN